MSLIENHPDRIPEGRPPRPYRDRIQPVAGQLVVRSSAILHAYRLLLNPREDRVLLLEHLWLALGRAGDALLDANLGEDALVERLLGLAARLEVLRSAEESRGTKLARGVWRCW